MKGGTKIMIKLEENVESHIGLREELVGKLIEEYEGRAGTLSICMPLSVEQFVEDYWPCSITTVSNIKNSSKSNRSEGLGAYYK